MKKSVWIFLFAVLLPSVVLGWLALRSAEEQQIVFERRTAELYQKETDSLAVTVRDTVDAERRVFGETVHRLLAKGDPEALARDFTNTLTDAWQMKAVGFAINREGKLVSPSVAAASKKPELHRFLLGNGGFLTSTEPAIVYNSAGDNITYRNPKLDQSRSRSLTAQNASGNAAGASAGKDASQANENANFDNETIAAGNANAAFGNTPLLLGNQSPVSPFPVAEQAFPQGSLTANSVAVVRGASTIILSGGVQLNCQMPENGSAFDFTGMMSTPDLRNAYGLLQQGTVSLGNSGLSWAYPESAKSRKAENSALFSETADQTPPLPVDLASMANGGGAARGSTDEKADKPALVRKEALAGASKPTPNDSPTVTVGEAESKRVHIMADAGKKPRPVEPEPDAGPMPTGRDAAASQQDGGIRRPMPGKRAAIAPSPAAPAPMPESVQEQAPPPPAAAPAPIAMPQAAMASKKAKNEFQSAPEPKFSKAMPAPMTSSGNSSQSATFKMASKNADDTAMTMSKNGAGNIILNSAISRQVEPQQVLGAQGPALSTVMPEEAEFRSLTEEGDDGLVARFVQDKLNLIFWVRPPEAPEMVFGCLVEAGHFSELWKDVLARHTSSARGARAALDSKPEFVLALLDDRGKPVATQPADAPARDWKRPFVASEIGEALPHWEAALYLASPTALAESARGLWRTLAFTIAGAVALIAFGGWLVVADARRQLALAQQKTDFVSNVSHELKTPLTSIRMFAELMHDRPQPAEKQGQYLRIITVEAERLTRLINNVLDFAKMGRKQKRIEMKPLDLHSLVARVWEGHEMHLREAGFTTRWEAAPGPYPVLGDDDALAQVLVNLISNAEKYSNGRKEVELHTWLDDGHANIAVLDRGMGVPNGDEKKIFEAFYRAHDSLASGIQGSGLGLTLAQRIAREHGGELRFERREGGGCRFTLCVPLAEKVRVEG